jgi:hypothetical protein
MVSWRAASAGAAGFLFAATLTSLRAAAIETARLDPVFGAAGVAPVDLSEPGIDIADAASPGVIGGVLLAGSARDPFALGIPVTNGFGKRPRPGHRRFRPPVGGLRADGGR